MSDTEGTTPALDLERLRELLAGASESAPWGVDRLNNGKYVVFGGSEAFSVGTIWSLVDAELIAALRNAAPALLSAVASLTQDRDEARDLAVRRANAYLDAVHDRNAARKEAEQAQAELRQVHELFKAVGWANEPKPMTWATLATDRGLATNVAALVNGLAALATSAPQPKDAGPDCQGDCVWDGERYWCGGGHAPAAAVPSSGGQDTAADHRVVLCPDVDCEFDSYTLGEMHDHVRTAHGATAGGTASSERPCDRTDPHPRHTWSLPKATGGHVCPGVRWSSEQGEVAP